MNFFVYKTFLNVNNILKNIFFFYIKKKYFINNFIIKKNTILLYIKFNINFLFLFLLNFFKNLFNNYNYKKLKKIIYKNFHFYLLKINLIFLKSFIICCKFKKNIIKNFGINFYRKNSENNSIKKLLKTILI